ncbi:uncharacterized protein si:ch211-119e14.1 [Hippoglossus stenolepis]|uniref:uncharacterized protein si:ch211-119e14.1 n=1 Tax=Hippoglossus stenolepis TaxID=195615 RepID=UPI00159C178C|nr:uncharacterized protein si:ch211-119e14.1 [Hippoglossus stenolepis]XP_047194840.1 uncharacterized protein si:ch211-119e14.1 [Hippoglossus stenolepis]
MADDYRQSTVNIMILSFFLVALLLLLFFFYKKMNQENDGEYTIQRMVLKEGGIRDQTRVAGIALGTRVRARLCPGSDSYEEGEEMQEVRDEEGQVEEGGSQGSYSEGSSQEEEEDNEEQGKGDNTSHDSSSSEGLKAGEQTRLTDQPEANVEMEGKREEVASRGEERGGSGLLIDLKQFSGSAIWSEEKGMEREVTSL